MAGFASMKNVFFSVLQLSVVLLLLSSVAESLNDFPSHSPTTLPRPVYPPSVLPPVKPSNLSPTNPPTLPPQVYPPSVRPPGKPSNLSPTNPPTLSTPVQPPTVLPPVTPPRTLSPTNPPTLPPPVQPPTVLPPVKPPRTLSPTNHPTLPLPVQTPSFSPVYLPPVHTPTLPSLVGFRFFFPHGYPSSHSPSHLPTLPPPVHSPSLSPAQPPSFPPDNAPEAPPAKYVVVEGVVYCKSCDSDTLSDPVVGAKVKLGCNITKLLTIEEEKTTDETGCFLFEASKKITISSVSYCKVFLVSSPYPKCQKKSKLNCGDTGATLKYEVNPKKALASDTYDVYTPGPLAFESNC
ncbi:gibberellin-regulated protein 14-like [Telopea speciosissima]|uniref:gibberellin-regulated protein 14-like n=1 Tax=Telopea speciosissima TaxID=54955 RepID=UPI001CC66C18|nr:gibberellin-regulated protein 14-like [Telopea speciosissima]